jgi:hypothetical protein
MFCQSIFYCHLLVNCIVFIDGGKNVVSVICLNYKAYKTVSVIMVIKGRKVTGLFCSMFAAVLKRGSTRPAVLQIS